MTRRAILVLGMHRSGTSALAGLLVHLGVQAPRTIMAANEYNERGYWESAAFHDYHERLLRAAGTEWDLWTRVGIESLDPAIAAQFDRDFHALLEQEYGSASVFVMKDPRVCRLIPFWLRQLSAANIEPAAILTVRSPLEVAKSLAARDGLGLEQSLLLWLRHVLDAEAATRTIRRSVVWYRDLLLDWRAVADRMAADLGMIWPDRTPDADARVAAFLGPDLRHHVNEMVPSDVAPLVGDWIRRTCEALERLVEPGGTGPTQASATLDGVRRDFDGAADVFGPPMEDERRARRRQGAREEDLSLLRLRELDEARQRVGRLQAELGQIARQRDDLAREFNDERQRLASDAQALSKRLESLSSRLEASDTRVLDLERSRSWRWTAPGRTMSRWLQTLLSRRPR